MHFLNKILAIVAGVSVQRTVGQCQRLGLTGTAGLLLPLLVFLTLSIAADAQTTTGTTTDGLIYTATNSQITITYYSGTGGVVNIPSTINGLPVTSIGSSAFFSCSNLTGVTIPSSVTNIGSSAFAGSGLTSVAIPSSVTNIGSSAFAPCTSLRTITVNASNTAYSSDSNGILFNKSQTTLIQCPAGNLTNNYTIPSTVTSIGSSSFWACDSLITVVIGNNVTSIGDSAFGCCLSLKSITVNASNTAYSSDANGVLFDKNKTTLIQYPPFASGSAYTIPSTVTSIGSSSFEESSLTSVTIPGSVKNIGSYAFGYCYSLIGITIPNSVTSIGDKAFCSCSGLTSVIIPYSVTSIGSGPFAGCSRLTTITVDTANTAYSSDANGVLFNKNQTTLIQYLAGKSASSYTISSKVTSIGSSAFISCTSLTSVIIPNSVTSIGSSAFWNCSGLVGMTIPTSVTSIGDNGFCYCSGMTSVTIPTSVINIGDNAFYGTSLTSVTIPASVTSVGFRAFNSCTYLKTAVFTGNAPIMRSAVFGSTASGFTVYYYYGAKGFTSPTWTDSYGDSYPAANMGTPPLASWLSINGFSSTANLQSAPKGDGVSLLMAYALNLDPTQNQSSSIPQSVIAGNQMSLSYYAGNANVTYTVQSSSDLHTWSTAEVTVSAPDANDFRTASVPLTGTARFMRLVVSH